MLYGSSGCSHLKNIFLLFMAVIHTAFSHVVDRGVFCLGQMEEQRFRVSSQVKREDSNKALRFKMH